MLVITPKNMLIQTDLPPTPIALLYVQAPQKKHLLLKGPLTLGSTTEGTLQHITCSSYKLIEEKIQKRWDLYAVSQKG